MDADPIIVTVEQPGLLEIQEVKTNELEASPALWGALEALTSPDLANRLTGLERLAEFNACRQIPLVAYVLATRIIEPDIELRARIVQILGSIIASTDKQPQTEDSVLDRIRNYLAACLSGMRTRQIFALLQVVEFDKSVEEAVARLLSQCSFAGGHLAQILSNRVCPLAIRRQAVNFIGRIGYLEALPAMERLAARLENRKDVEDVSILPDLQETIRLLNYL